MAKKVGLKPVHRLNFGRAGELNMPKQYHRVIDDGNCFFRCISYILTGSEDYHATIRKQVVAHVSTIQEKLTGYLDKHPDIYIAQSSIEHRGIWATDKEIMTTANLLDCDVIIYTRRGGDTRKWLPYPASFSLLKTSENDIYLDNVADTHYDVVKAVVSTK